MVSSRHGSPTLRRRQLGMQLRRLRETAGITIDQVGTVLTSAYVGLESAAEAVRSYEALVVPWPPTRRFR